MRKLHLGLSLLAGILSLPVAAQAIPITNLAQSSNAQGIFGPSLTGGQAGGIIDRSIWGFNGIVTSPRVNNTYVQPYLTWSSDQNVRILRILNDTFAATYDRLIVDTLNTGGNPTNNADWTQRFDTGAGLANPGPFDLNLGATYSTRGVRVRANRSGLSGDFAFGEMEVYTGFPVSGTLADNRISVPTANYSASSTLGGTSPGFAGQWNDRWLSQSQVNNGGSAFTLDRHFTTATNVTNLSLAFANKNDNGVRVVPTSWDIFVKTTGNATWTLAGTYTSSNSNLATPATWYYLDLPGLYNVTDLRVSVPFSSVGSDAIGIHYTEAFNLPEPSAALFAGGAVVGMMARRRFRKSL